MEEIYKPIQDYPNYEISNHGNVRNVMTGKQKETRLNKVGYYVVELFKKI